MLVNLPYCLLFNPIKMNLIHTDWAQDSNMSDEESETKSTVTSLSELGILSPLVSKWSVIHCRHKNDFAESGIMPAWTSVSSNTRPCFDAISFIWWTVSFGLAVVSCAKVWLQWPLLIPSEMLLTRWIDIPWALQKPLLQKKKMWENVNGVRDCEAKELRSWGTGKMWVKG